MEAAVPIRDFQLQVRINQTMNFEISLLPKQPFGVI